MKNLDNKDVLHIAKLANLSLTEEEVEKFSRQLSETLSYVEKLDSLNTSKVEPTFQTTGLINRSRPDEKKESLSIDQALKNTKSKYKNYFKIKSIF